jgi:hypothetical protein
VTVPQLPVRQTDVRAEFGGIPSTPLSAYIKGGAFVPVQTIAPIPSVLPLNLAAFAGANYPAQLTFNQATVDNGYTIGTAVVAPDLSTATIVLTRTKVVNGGSSFFEAGTLRLLFDISGAINPTVIIRLPATQPRDGNGYWKQISASNFQRICTPATLTPTEDYTTFDHFWHAQDINTTYQGEFRLNTLIPVGNQPTPPQALPSQGMLGAQARVDVTMLWSMNIGTAPPPGVQMTWNTRNGTNTWVEFPIIIDVYDNAVLKASYPMLLHVEVNALLTFNPS